eukprot:102719-Prymnesium_polylepis.2
MPPPQRPVVRAAEQSVNDTFERVSAPFSSTAPPPLPVGALQDVNVTRVSKATADATLIPPPV